MERNRVPIPPQQPLGRADRCDDLDATSARTVQEVVATEPLAKISTYLRSDKNLSREAANAIDELVKATYERLRTTG